MSKTKVETSPVHLTQAERQDLYALAESRVRLLQADALGSSGERRAELEREARRWRATADKLRGSEA